MGALVYSNKQHNRMRSSLFCLAASLVSLSVARPNNRFSKGNMTRDHKVDRAQINEVSSVVDNISRIARSFDSDAFDKHPRFQRQSEAQDRQDESPKPYRFGYAVQDDEGNDFNHQEQSDGLEITGQYSVLLPDGRIQTVSYSVRPETGFVAEVSYTEA